MALSRDFPLAQRNLATCGELLLTDGNYEILLSFVLAPNKDLAVSYLYYYKHYHVKTRELSALAAIPVSRIPQPFGFGVTVRTSYLAVGGC